MTATTTTGPAPVPFQTRVQFEDRVRLAAGNAQVYGQPDDTDAICQAARNIAADYPWADTRTTANALVDALGTGWGAIYLHWAHEQERRPGRA